MQAQPGGGIQGPNTPHSQQKPIHTNCPVVAERLDEVDRATICGLLDPCLEIVRSQDILTVPGGPGTGRDEGQHHSRITPPPPAAMVALKSRRCQAAEVL
jgi:hypothetical protein